MQMQTQTPVLAHKVTLKPVAGKTLLPPKTGGKLFLPGYHRTRQENAAASIIMDSLDPKKMRDSCLYGKGFYMSRTLTNQKKRRMISSYGEHLVRVRVDISRFICFDRAIAKRVWGEHHTLKDQLKEFGPWKKDEQGLINAYSKGLSAFWDNKKSPDAVYVRRGYSSKQRIKNTSDIALVVHSSLHICKKVPGIAYTGSSDGACLVAHNLDRVKPLAMTKLATYSSKKLAKDLDWLDANDRRVHRQYAPLTALRDDIATYVKSLSQPHLSLEDKKKLIAQSYAALPTDCFEQFTFSIALTRVCRSKNLHDQRDAILEQSVPRFVNELLIDMPGIGYEYHNLVIKPKNRKQKYELKEGEGIAARYRQVIGVNKTLMEHIRYHVFQTMAHFHRNVMLPSLMSDIKEYTSKIRNNKTRLSYYYYSILRPLFGATVDDYGDIVADKDKRHVKGCVYVDGVILIEDILKGHRSLRLYKNPRNAKKATPAYYKMVGHEEYVHFMRSQILRIYDYLRKNETVQSHGEFKKVLETWYRKNGVHYRKMVAASPDYDHIW